MTGKDDGTADQPCPASEAHVAATDSQHADQPPPQEIRYAAFESPYGKIRNEQAEREGHGFCYDVGKTYRIPEGRSPAEPHCGFWSFDNPFDAMRLKLGHDRISIVTIDGQIERRWDGRACSSEITIVEDLTLGALIRHAMAWMTRRGRRTPAGDDPAKTAPTEAATVADGTHAVGTGDRARAIAAGQKAYALTVGNHGCAMTTGERAAAVATGDYGRAATAGDKAVAVATGQFSQATTSGTGSHAIAAGYPLSSATTSGSRAHAVAIGGATGAGTTGQGSHAVALERASARALGHDAVAVSLGSTAQAGGNNAIAFTIGKDAYAGTAGRNAVACSLGPNGIAVAEAGSWIVLAAHDDDGNIIDVRAAKVGRNGIYPGLAYRLDRKGRFKRYTPPARAGIVWPRNPRVPLHLKIYHKIYDRITGRIPRD